MDGQPFSVYVPNSDKINGKNFLRANRQFVFFPENIGEEEKKVFTAADVLFSPENIGEEQKKGLYVRRCPSKKIKGQLTCWSMRLLLLLFR